MTIIHWLDDCPDPAAAGVGGKGASLIRLHAGGFPVPAGFVVGANGYQAWLAHNGLNEPIQVLLDVPNLRLPKVARGACASLRTALESAELPPAPSLEVTAAYDRLRARRGEQTVVAVRSSALSEDGSASSSAGLYETYLNIRDLSSVLESLRRCYISLWAHRAVQYRAFKRIDSSREAMGVVIMEMIPSDVAGVAFTVNPVTGSTDEIMINASWGLGEAIVSGRVTPDNFLVRKSDLSVLSTDIYAKELMILADPSGESGTVSVDVPPERMRAPALTAVQVASLAELCLRIERHCGGPQDVEWAIHEGRFYVLQSRPVTALR